MRLTFTDYLKDHLHRAGLYEWAEDKPLRRCIQSPEFLKAVERAWLAYRKDQRDDLSH